MTLLQDGDVCEERKSNIVDMRSVMDKLAAKLEEKKTRVIGPVSSQNTPKQYYWNEIKAKFGLSMSQSSIKICVSSCG